MLQVHAKGRAPVFAYSNVFGEGGMNGTGVYYLASAAEKVGNMLMTCYEQCYICPSQCA
jgi:hypothetical protein